MKESGGDDDPSASSSIKRITACKSSDAITSFHDATPALRYPVCTLSFQSLNIVIKIDRLL